MPDIIWSGHDRAAAEDTPRTLIEAACQRLRQDIVAGHYAPGEKLRVEHLKDRYEVGAGTLREALARLAAETLVVAQGQRGFSVASLSLADFEDLTRTRINLECEALRLSILHGDDAWEGQIMASFHRLGRAQDKLDEQPSLDTVREWEERNRAFHRSLLAACPSAWTLHFLGILYQQSERYRRYTLQNRPIPRNIHHEHEAIMQATIARDTDRALQLIARHIALTLDAVRSAPPDTFVRRPAGRRTALDRSVAG
jgi:GntR family carbon starvation induced transcriptional regulator